jgi:NitT/TauT family transport system ATP-binding protein
MAAVTKEFTAPRGAPVAALGPVDLTVGVGEFVAVVGPSGCGKSTLLRLGAGLLPPTQGVIDRSAAGASFVFQESALLPWRTIEHNCALPLELAGVGRTERKERVRAILDFVGLGAWGRYYPDQLSGGMKMRAALARALVPDADLIYFDEPFSATDEINRARLNEHLSKLWQARRFAAVFVTHSIEEAVFLGQRVLVMSERPGRLLGEVEVPFEFPRHEPLRTSEEFVRVERRVVELLHSGPGLSDADAEMIEERE